MLPVQVGTIKRHLGEPAGEMKFQGPTVGKFQISGKGVEKS